MSWRVRWAFVALSIIWGLPYFFIKVALRDVDPLLICWSRVTLAALILLPVAARRGGLSQLRRHLGAVVAFAVVEFAIPFWLIPLGERWISSSVTGILLAAVPLATVLLARYVGVHERLSVRRALGLAVGFIGVIVLVGLVSISGAYGWAGVGCMLISTVGYALGALVVQRHFSGIDPVAPLAVSLGVAGLLLTIPAALTLPSHLPSVWTFGALAVLGMLCTATAMLLMFYLIRKAGAMRASVVTYVNPAVASVVGVTLLGESLGLSELLGLGLILVGSWLATHGPSPRSAMMNNRGKASSTLPSSSGG
jgi:drug/metabolite transporter (DMT)-like permease